MAKVNASNGDATHTVNPPFVTSLKVSPTKEHLGFSLGNGIIGAYRIFGRIFFLNNRLSMAIINESLYCVFLSESKVGKSKHIYLGQNPAFHISAHSTSVVSMAWLPNTNKKDLQMVSIGTDQLIKLTRESSRPKIHSAWSLRDKPSTMAVNNSTENKSILIGDVEGGIKQLVLL